MHVRTRATVAAFARCVLCVQCVYTTVSRSVAQNTPVRAPGSRLVASRPHSHSLARVRCTLYMCSCAMNAMMHLRVSCLVSRVCLCACARLHRWRAGQWGTRACACPLALSDAGKRARHRHHTTHTHKSTPSLSLYRYDPAHTNSRLVSLHVLVNVVYCSTTR